MGELRQRGAIWWIRYYRAGKRYEERSGSAKKQAAIDLLRVREGAVAHGVPVTSAIGRYRFEDAADDLQNEYRTNDRSSLDELERRIRLHLQPFFAGCRMATITTADIHRYVAHRREAGIVRKGVRVKDVSNAEVNRELAVLKRMFVLAVQGEKLLRRPDIPMLEERGTRVGFFEREQLDAVLCCLPAPLQPVIECAYITGWRIDSEILPLEWRQVDVTAGEIRLDPETTKNRDGRVFPLTDDLRALVDALYMEHRQRAQAGQITPHVFVRMVAKGRGGTKYPQPIRKFVKAWKAACRAAGCPGRIPHDLRRTAIRNMVRRGVPERVAMQLAGHKTRSVFDRYNIVSSGDLQTARLQLSGLIQSAPGKEETGS